ncbi:MAG: CDP-alcohol phosphatidyltransferase family protein, partial [Dehalococcoidia bacterium]|nr:CDP-alcohol phosphatidyltransferase family protein [Dehalococcoidia bacterium]
LARWLAQTPATPNQVSLASFAIAMGSLGLFLCGQNLLAGLAAQTSSVVDGIDGDLARFKGTGTPSGAFLDAVLDRYADVAILAGLALWSLAFESKGLRELTLLVATLAIVGALMVSYSRARAEASLGAAFQGLPGFLASRDTRLFLVMLGAVLGQGLATLSILAVLSNGAVLWRLALVAGLPGGGKGLTS